MKIIADQDIPYLKGVLEPFVEIIYMPGKEISNGQLKDADALLIRTRTICNKQLLHHTRVQFIGTATIGYDHIDVAYCEANNIVWKNAPGCNAASVDQYIASSLVRLAGKHGFSLADKSIGVVGVGHVGSRVVRTTELLGMHVYLCDPPRVEKEGVCGFITMDGILRECDIITFHVPLHTGGIYNTHHMINYELVMNTNPGTILINTSRGQIADTEILKSSLESARLKGLVADVWENEPDIDRDLLHMTDIATAHIAGYSADGKANGTTMIVNELNRFFHFGFSDWHPTNVPLPDHPEVEINCTGLNEEEIMAKAILSAYDVLEDDLRFKNAPGDFEKLRSEYPVRREFQSYTLKMKGSWSGIERRCRRMGFKVIT